MLNYFDYISDESLVQEGVNDTDDENSIYNEMDASICEFDSYVQEGVGLAIAAGVGGAAILGGLIALIIKHFGSSSSASVGKLAKQAKKIAIAAQQSNEPVPENVEMPTVEAIKNNAEVVEAKLDEVIDAAEEILEKSDKSTTVRKKTKSERRREQKEMKKQNNSKSVVTSWDDMIIRFTTMEDIAASVTGKNKYMNGLAKEIKKGQDAGYIHLSQEDLEKFTKRKNEAAAAVVKTSNDLTPAAKLIIQKPSFVREVRDKRQSAT